MAASGIAKRYAQAFFQLTNSPIENAQKQLETLKVLEELFAGQDANRVLVSPVMPVELKKELIEYALKQANADETARKFISSVVDSRRVTIIPELVSAYEELINESMGVVTAEVTSAVDLPKDDLDSISTELGKLLDRKVKLHPEVNRDLLGGMVVRVGNYRIDMSLKSRLEGLAQTAVR